MSPSFSPSSRHYAFWGSAVLFILLNAGMAGIGNIGKNTPLFTALYLLAFIALIFLMKWFPQEWPTKRQLLVIMLLSLIMRAIFLYFPASGDTNRYVWEGYLLNQGINPFLHPPDSEVLRPFVEELRTIWEGVNHKDASACYPPFSMLTFRLGAFLAPTKFVFNAIIIAFDLGTVWVLLLLLKAYKRPLYHVLLFALNPLVLVYIAGESHLDSIQNFFIWLCFYFLFRQKERLGFISLGAATMSKYFSVIFAPFLFTKKNWKNLLFLSITVVLLYLPFWETGMHLFTSLKPFGLVMHYNDSLTVFLREWFGPNATLVSVILLAACFAFIFLLVHDPLKSCYLAAGSLLLLISTLHPWYLTLLTPFLVFFPSRAWLYLHAAVLFTFPVLHYSYYTGIFQEIHWIKWFEYLPFYVLLIWDTFRNKPYFTDRRFAPIQTVSIIIPVLNEAEHLAQCIDAVNEHPAVKEILVADCGSTDDTRRIAEEKGACVLQAPRGRGHQIHTGISQAQGDLMLILHADCVLHTSTVSRIIEQLERSPQYIGGSVGMKYSQRPLANRFIEWLNNTRSRWTGIAFGDQAQFFRKEALEFIGGFPQQMLMEDIEISMRLKEHGSLCFLPDGVTVSMRRWERTGFMPNFVKVIWLCLTYLLQRRLGLVDGNAQTFYEHYYGVPLIQS